MANEFELMKKVSINMATYPKTRRYCKQVLDGLVDVKCDIVRVYLNEYTEIPDEFPKGDKFHYHLGDENIMDSGKFYFMQPNEYYFTIDDDLLYTQEYFRKSLEFMKETGYVAVTTFGKVLKPQPRHFVDVEMVVSWRDDVKDNYICNVAGTCLSLFDTDKIYFNSNYFKHHGMTDLEVARIFQVRQFPIICRAHEASEVKYLADDFKETLWDRREELVEKHDEILRSVPEWDLFEHKRVLWLTNYIHDTLINDEKITRSGQYLWIRSMGADVRRWAQIRDKESINDYDIIHMNLAPNDLDLALEVRSILGEKSNTKLICQADHGVDVMNGVFNFQLFKQAVNAADYVIGVEEMQCRMLRFLTQKPVIEINNPVDVEFVRGVQGLTQENRVGVISHCYQAHEAYLGQAFDRLCVPVDLLAYQGQDAIRLMKTYDTIHGDTDYLNFLRLLTKYKVLVDGHLSYSIGRVCMDAAALGIPMICSERSETAKVLYPHTLVNPYDVGEIRELTERLLNDIVFYHNVVSTALERVAEFDMFKTKTRLLNHLSND